MIPEVSVVMSIYNSEMYLEECIQSILNQSFTNFEFIIVCEYETSQESRQIVEQYANKDSRIIPVFNKKRLGFPESLNVGLRMASGEYIARMDADDVSGKRRLEIQKLYMDRYPNIGICGTHYEVIGGKNWIVDYYSDPRMNECIELFGNFTRHPTIMIRKSIIDKYNLYYDGQLPGAEDVDYFLRASQVTDLYNILDRNLFFYRRTGENVSLLQADRDINIMIGLQKKYYERRLGMNLSDTQIQRLLFFAFLRGLHNKEDIINEVRELDQLLIMIKTRNDQIQIYDTFYLNRALEHRWLRAKYSLNQKYAFNIPEDVLLAWREGTYYSEWMC